MYSNKGSRWEGCNRIRSVREMGRIYNKINWRQQNRTNKPTQQWRRATNSKTRSRGSNEEKEKKGKATGEDGIAVEMLVALDEFSIEIIKEM